MTDNEMARRDWEALSPALQRSFHQIAGPHWLTAAELKPATGMGLTLLVTRHQLAERRWVRWGGELGQKSGEGYEYRLTERGMSVLGWLLSHEDDSAAIVQPSTAKTPVSEG